MDKFKFIFAVSLTGNLGVFVNMIDLPSPLVSAARMSISAAFLLLVLFLTRTPIHWEQVRSNALPLALSGLFFGFNSILIFESYRYITVAVATLCDYMAPVFAILLAPLVLGERLTRIHLLCTAGSFTGILLISGVLSSGSAGDLRGIALGLAGGGCYCGMILCNRKMRPIEDLARTFFQLFVAALVCGTYLLFHRDLITVPTDARTVGILLIIGVVITGFGFVLYFSALSRLPTLTSCLLSYLEPIVAIISSALVLHQTLSGMQLAGTVLILASTLLGELGEHFSAHNSPEQPDP